MLTLWRSLWSLCSIELQIVGLRRLTSAMTRLELNICSENKVQECNRWLTYICLRNRCCHLPSLYLSLLTACALSVSKCCRPMRWMYEKWAESWDWFWPSHFHLPGEREGEERERPVAGVVGWLVGWMIGRGASHFWEFNSSLTVLTIPKPTSNKNPLPTVTCLPGPNNSVTVSSGGGPVTHSKLHSMSL